jgi:hypothetical protein
MPADLPGRRDRLAVMFGFAACLEALDQSEEAEKVFRQCVAFAWNLHGPATPGYAAGLVPLADFRLRAGYLTEAAQLIDEAYDVLWRHGDPAVAAAVATRAELMKAVGRAGDPFADLVDVADEVAVEAVATVLARSGRGDGARLRQVFADLLKFVDRRFGDAHPALADTLAAIAHHEGRLGEAGDARARSIAARRSVWTYAKTRAPAGLLASLEVGFEPDGTIHLVPHLSRDPNPNEAVHLEVVLTQAVDDLYARPARKPGG